MQFLVEPDQPDDQYRLQSLLVAGEHYQIARIEDLQHPDKTYCAKTIAYDPERIQDKAYVQRRVKAMEADATFSQALVQWTPSIEAKRYVNDEDAPNSPEPVLITEYLIGKTLEQIVEIEGPLDPEHARAITLELANFLKACHDQGWIFRNLHPSHVIIAADDSVAIAGTGNATPLKAPPIRATNPDQFAYLAPEIRDEVGGSTLIPPADLYSLGALLSFMLTGEHPRVSTENPLTATAYNTLSNLKPEGLALIVAKCMAPMAKNRLPDLDALLPYLQPNQLPTPATPNFGMFLLPAPWSGAESPGRGSQSSISPGPLISVPAKEKSAKEKSVRHPHHVSRTWGLVILILVSILALILVLIQ